LTKIAIIGTVGLPAKYGGWETLVNNLTSHLDGKFCFEVYCSSRSYDIKITTCNGAKLIYINLKANGIQSILYDSLSMLHALRGNADIMLILGVSGSIFLPILRLFTKKKFIINIDGLEWKRQKWGYFTKIFLKFSEFLAVRKSDIVIADNEQILKYISTEYNVKAVLIPYGGDHVLKCKLYSNSSLILKYPFLNKKYAITVCRVEPENNLDMILLAFTRKLIDYVVVGNWDASSYGISLRRKFMNFKNIHLVDPVYKQEEIDLIRSNAFFYVHGHSAGGTNPSLVEAMHLSLPIFCFDVGFNRSTTLGLAFYFNDVFTLENLILNVSNAELDANAKNMKNIANLHYKWDVVCKKYGDVFLL